MNKKIIFILPNIYEIINGVSTKYIKFINFLSINYEIILMTSFQNNNTIDNIDKNDNIKLVKINGLNIPFYKEIKIPIIKYKDIEKQLINKDEIIIFNGEFIWMYNILIKLKKKYTDLKIYPTMHTDYVYYANKVYSICNFTSTLNYLDHYLENKYFSGIIVTGIKMQEKYSNYTNSIFNANEINLDIFNSNKIDEYDLSNEPFLNFIYTGRISKEKNIEEIFSCISNIYELLLKKYNNLDFMINIIGDGPYLDNLKSLLDIEFKNIKSKVSFHGSKTQIEINKIYQTLYNRIFIFTSISETFGKTPLEAAATGIPIFIKDCDNTNSLYKNKKDAFIFNNNNEFMELLEYFIKMDYLEKQIFISNSINNVKKYDQKIIFNDWIDFLLNGKVTKNRTCLLYTSPSPRDRTRSRMPSSA